MGMRCRNSPAGCTCTGNLSGMGFSNRVTCLNFHDELTQMSFPSGHHTPSRCSQVHVQGCLQHVFVSPILTNPHMQPCSNLALRFSSSTESGMPGHNSRNISIISVASQSSLRCCAYSAMNRPLRLATCIVLRDSPVLYPSMIVSVLGVIDLGVTSYTKQQLLGDDFAHRTGPFD